MKDLDKIEVNKIEKAIINGKVIVMPTDTVYGLICNARNKKAVKKIFKIKKRDSSKPIGIFVKNIQMAKEIAEIGLEHEKLLKQKWFTLRRTCSGAGPGKFTFILKKKKSVDKSQQIFCGTKQSIGIRVPDYKLINQLFKKIDFPLAQTSANISGKPATTKILDILKQFENNKIKPDIIVDAGNLLKSKPSKVIDLTRKEPKILRE